ncbi:tetratricopeptide repeat protein [Thermochromatium tepidum]|nr:tetratricopeptide repeat protein [Thermochromatium tepidum]
MRLLASQKYAEAESAARRFIDLYPQDPFGWKLIGVIYFYLGRYKEAEHNLLKSITINNKDPESISTLGNALRQQGRIKEALECYDRSLEIDPDHSPALNGKGLCLMDYDRHEEALVCLERALDLNPKQPEIYYNLGGLVGKFGRLIESVNFNRKAIELNPRSAEAYNNLGLSLQDLGEIDEAIKAYEKAVALDPKSVSYFSNLLFALNYHPDRPAEDIFTFYQEFDRRFSQPYRVTWRPFINTPDPERRLRIGYVSPDFGFHSIGYFLEPLLENHDRNQFELTAYAQRIGSDTQTLRYRRLVDRWVPTSRLSDDELAERIRADGIDILVDLAGHTAGNRLGVFARRPAPVSVSWMGYGYTTGLSAIDYFLTDPVMVPPDADHLFAERPWRLDPPALAYRPHPGMGEVGPLPARRDGQVTFGTLTRGIRINPRVIGVWSEILKRLPGARLVVDSKSFAHEAEQARLAERFAAHGIERGRLEIGYHSPPWDVLRRIDIGLDCFPHNSGTTLVESLYLGVPFITLAARPSVGRIGSSILCGLGHPEWIAQSESEYIDKAVALAGDLERLATIRANLRPEFEASPWRDEVGFARRVEQAYRQMWRQWCATAPNNNKA